MLKIIYSSFLFFLLEMLLFVGFQEQISELFLNSNKKFFNFSNPQKHSLLAISKIKQQKEKTFYFVGGSTGIFFFGQQGYLKKITHSKLYRDLLMKSFFYESHLTANLISSNIEKKQGDS